ncbi:MAG: mucoidy inhibitor MuiA family protein [Verrucomicrobiae bacterium]|nr:mucoidy inhibitor MuiA family protein [Verrucomicrobiae bacterium]
MKTIPSLITAGALAALMFYRLHGAETLTPSADIAEVTVYPDRAVVTREARLRLVPGSNLVDVTGLPMNLDENSVRVSGETRGDVRVEGFELRTKHGQEPVTDEAKKTEEEIRKNADLVRAIHDERAALQEKQNALNEMRGKFQAKAEKDARVNELKPADLKGLLDFYAGEFLKITERRRMLDFQERDLQEKNSKLSQKLAFLRKPAAPHTRSVLVTLSSTDNTDARLKVVYTINGASWTPQYDARVTVAQDKIQFVSYAVVRNATGEDWKNVGLTLSTARPGLGAGMPELAEWVVDVEDPSSPGSSKIPQKNVPGDEKNRRAINRSIRHSGREGLPEPASAAPSQESAFYDQTAEVFSSGVSATFKVPTPASIPSDNHPHRTTVAILDLKNKIEYLVTPKLESRAFLRAEVKNTLEAALLPGDVSIFLDNDFIGRTRINLVSPEAGFPLFLGSDDSFKISRMETQKSDEEKGFLEKSRLRTRHYEITVTNFKKTAQSVTVYDQIPVSLSDKVKVKLISPSLKEKEFDPHTGRITWQIKMVPKETIKIKFGFTVESDPKTEVAGLLD